MLGTEEKFIKTFGEETWRREAAWKDNIKLILQTYVLEFSGSSYRQIFGSFEYKN
jgi:hypothetical protein